MYLVFLLLSIFFNLVFGLYVVQLATNTKLFAKYLPVLSVYSYFGFKFVLALYDKLQIKCEGPCYRFLARLGAESTEAQTPSKLPSLIAITVSCVLYFLVRTHRIRHSRETNPTKLKLAQIFEEKCQQCGTQLFKEHSELEGCCLHDFHHDCYFVRRAVYRGNLALFTLYCSLQGMQSLATVFRIFNSFALQCRNLMQIVSNNQLQKSLLFKNIQKQAQSWRFMQLLVPTENAASSLILVCIEFSIFVPSLVQTAIQTRNLFLEFNESARQQMRGLRFDKAVLVLVREQWWFVHCEGEDVIVVDGEEQFRSLSKLESKKMMRKLAWSGGLRRLLEHF